MRSFYLICVCVCVCVCVLMMWSDWGLGEGAKFYFKGLKIELFAIIK